MLREKLLMAIVEATAATKGCCPEECRPCAEFVADAPRRWVRVERRLGLSRGADDDGRTEERGRIGEQRDRRREDGHEGPGQHRSQDERPGAGQLDPRVRLVERVPAEDARDPAGKAELEHGAGAAHEKRNRNEERQAQHARRGGKRNDHQETCAAQVAGDEQRPAPRPSVDPHAERDTEEQDREGLRESDERELRGRRPQDDDGDEREGNERDGVARERHRTGEEEPGDQTVRQWAVRSMHGRV